MKSYINAALCVGFMMAIPSVQASNFPYKSDWKAYVQEKMVDAYLLTNRVCDGDLFMVWPILGSVVGYDFERSVDLFLKINAGRLLINVAAQQFEQMDQARSSIAVGLFVRLAHAAASRTALHLADIIKIT